MLAVVILSALLASAPALAECDPALKAANGGTCPTGRNGAKHNPRPEDPLIDHPCMDVTLPAMNHITVKSQDGMGICYAEAASALVDYYRFTHKDENYDHQTSPVEAAISAGTAGWFRKTTVNGGEVSDVLDSVRSSGTCDQRSALEAVPNRTLSETADMFRTYFDRWHTYLSGLPPASRLALTRPMEVNMQLGRITSEVRVCMASLNLPADKLPGLEAIGAALDQDNPLVYLKAIMANACVAPHKFKPGIPSSQHYGYEYTAQTDMIQKINEVLARKTPVSISFCAKVLEQGRWAVGITDRHLINRFNFSNVETTDCGMHAVVIEGRRLDPTTGKCQYQIRNSWGTSCNGISPDWECSEGNIWVDVDDITRNSVGLDWL